MSLSSNTSTSGRSTGAGSATANNLRSTCTSSRASINYGSIGHVPERQETSEMYNSAILRFNDASRDAPFVPAASFEPGADGLAAVQARYSQHDTARQLQTMLLPLLSPTGICNGGPNPAPGSTDEGDGSQTTTLTTQDTDSDSLLSLSDDDEPDQSHPPA